MPLVNTTVIYIFSHIKPKFLSNKLVFSTENVEKSGFWDAHASSPTTLKLNCGSWGLNQFSSSYHNENFTHSLLRKFLIKFWIWVWHLCSFKGFPMVYLVFLHVSLSTIQFENHLNAKSTENQLENLRYQNYTKTWSVWQHSWTTESYQNCTNFFRQNWINLRLKIV